MFSVQLALGRGQHGVGLPHPQVHLPAQHSFCRTLNKDDFLNLQCSTGLGRGQCGVGLTQPQVHTAAQHSFLKNTK